MRRALDPVSPEVFVEILVQAMLRKADRDLREQPPPAKSGWPRGRKRGNPDARLAPAREAAPVRS